MLVISRTVTMRRGLWVGTVLQQQMFRISAAKAGIECRFYNMKGVRDRGLRKVVNEDPSATGCMIEGINFSTLCALSTPAVSAQIEMIVTCGASLSGRIKHTVRFELCVHCLVQVYRASLGPLERRNSRI